MKSLAKKINWEKGNGLVPAIIQDASNGLVLMLGYMDRKSLAKTQSTNSVWFYSRTKHKLWKKGQTSGNTLQVKDIKLDCDNDTLLIKVVPAGPACHTGKISCFKDDNISNEIQKLFSVIEKRKNELPANSYTTSLFKAGLDRIALKVSEESLEVIQAATKEKKQRLTEETVDLIYHLLVLLVEKKISLLDIDAEMKKRSKV